MKLYSLHAINEWSRVIEREGLSLTRIVPIAKQLMSDGWVVTLYLHGQRPASLTKPEEMR